MLLCVLDLLLTHAPDRLRAHSLDDVAAQCPADAPEGARTLAYLCAVHNADFAEAHRVQQQLFAPLLAALRDGHIVTHQPARMPTHSALLGSLYLGGLLERHLAANDAALAHEYELAQAAHSAVAFDERLFMERPEQIGSPTRVSSPSAYYYPRNAHGAASPEREPMSKQRRTQQLFGSATASVHNARAFNSARSVVWQARIDDASSAHGASSSPASSPARRLPATPISAAQHSVQWLHAAVADQPPAYELSASFAALVAECLADDDHQHANDDTNDASTPSAALDAVRQRLVALLSQLDVQPAERKTLAAQLYGRLLEVPHRTNAAAAVLARGH